MKSTRLLFYLLSCWSSFSLLGCQDKDTDPAAEQLIQVSYAQTFCSDPWTITATGGPALEAAATAYLQQQGVSADQLRAEVKGEPEACNACGCKTGVVLEGGVRQKDLATVEKLGFRRL